MRKILPILLLSLFLLVFLPSLTFAQDFGENLYGTGEFGIGPSTAPNNNSNNSSGNNSNGNNGGGGCSAQPPTGTPDLFQIDAFMTSVTLYYSPYVQPYTGFQIVYGFKQGDTRYSTTTSIQNSKGPVSTTINLLSPNTTYYFKVAGMNDCVGGAYSNTLSAKTGWTPFKKTTYYAYSKGAKTSQVNAPSNNTKSQPNSKTQPLKQNTQVQPNQSNNGNSNQSASQQQNNPQPPSNQNNFAPQPQKQTGFIQSVVGWVKGLFGK